jgi:hypothetical protein
VRATGKGQPKLAHPARGLLSRSGQEGQR